MSTVSRHSALTADRVIAVAHQCGFELAGIASALPADDYARFEAWRQAGYAADMAYLTDHRADLRYDPRHLLPTARSILCVGKLYNTGAPYSTEFFDAPGAETKGWISRYAWGRDYHDVLRSGLERAVELLRAESAEPFEARVCVDTTPLLERTYARLAGLGWIGKNTCLINQQSGSWFFLGEVLLSLNLAANGPPPDRCGSCTRCIDACPTAALVPARNGEFTLDSARCISYLTIEKRGEFTTAESAAVGGHVFGCDICQDVCPWNRKAPVTDDASFAAQHIAPELRELASLSEDGFRNTFHGSPVKRAKWKGIRRNANAARRNKGLADNETS